MNSVSSDARECPICGFNGTQHNPENCLAIGCRIAGRYVVGGLYDSDGDTISYNGYDMSTSEKVTVREFFPLNGCYRAEDGVSLMPKVGAEQHYKNALTGFCNMFYAISLADNQGSLLAVNDFFKANNTAYAIIESFDGVPLIDFLKMNGGAIRYDQCLQIIEPLVEAVSALHEKNIIHRGISPYTVFINRNGDVKLGGYATASVRSKGLDSLNKLFAGYSAPEQYQSSYPKSKATDVYGLAATVYRCLTGLTPQEADHRRSYDNLQPAVETDPTIPLHVSRALDLALLVNDTERIQTVGEFYSLLENQQYTAKPDLSESEPVYDEEDETDYEEEYDDNYYEDDDDDYVEDRRTRLSRFVMFTAVGLFLISLVAFVIYACLPKNGADGDGSSEGSGVTLTVPDYTGQTLDGEIFVGSEFLYEIVNEQTAGALDNQVIRQYPIAGTSVSKGDTITLYVNRVRVISMVNLMGLDMNACVEMMKGLGVLDYRFEQDENSDAEEGEVIGQSVAAGEPFNIYADQLVITIAFNADTAGDEEPEE